MIIKHLRRIVCQRKSDIVISTFKTKVENLEKEFCKFVLECDNISNQIKEINLEIWVKKPLAEQNDIFLYFNDANNAILKFFRSYKNTFLFSDKTVERTKNKSVYINYLKKFFSKELLTYFSKFVISNP